MSKMDEIKLAFANEQSNPRPAITASDVPGRYDAITPQWLTAILCRDVPGAEVVSFKQGEKDDGSSNRRRLFLTYNAAGQRAELPATAFCKAAEQLESRLMLGFAGTSLGEVNFFNKVRRRLDIEAPVAYHAGFDENNFAYIVVMKDIADTATFCDERTKINWDKAVSMVTLLATMHATFFEHPDLGTEAVPYKRWADFWNNMLEHSKGWEVLCNRAVELAESVVPPRLFKRRAEIWRATTASVLRHNVLPKTLTHCDVHLKNWYIAGQNRMGLADWQIMTIGHWSRDLAYAVTTALTVENRRAWENDLVRIYVDKMSELGVARISIEEALLNFRQQLFTALAFWTITLVPAPGMPAMQPESTSYKFIERMTAAIDDLDALDSFN